MIPTLPTPDQLVRILIERLQLSENQESDFLYPQYKIGNIWDFSDMEQAISRLQQAVIAHEKIGIYADYDCDGIPGAVVLLDLCKAIGISDRVFIYIPDRHDEGYGLSTLGINTLQEKGVTLIITVDLGITALAEVADAQSRGIDVIVTDHHQPLEIFPSAYAVIHPKRGIYRNQEPCGAGVAFYLVCAFLEKYGQVYGIKPGWEKWLLDLVGFATLSDMVPLVRENRMLATYGMMVMRKTRRVGLQVLFNTQRIDMRSLIETDLTFTVAPRLNAASRMATPMLAFELLSTEDIARAKEIVAELESINNERKVLVAQIVKEAHRKIDNRVLPEIVVLGDLTWRPAVLGLVATKLQETYSRSFFVWGESGDGLIKGSCRMAAQHHAAFLFQALPDGVLLHAGGHQAAGGFAVAKDRIHFLEDELNSALTRVDHNNESSEVIDSIVMPLAIVTTRHLQKIRTLAPFGTGNPQPLFYFRDVVVGSVKMFGKHKEHLECTISDSTGTAIAFTFFVDEVLKQTIVPGVTISIIASLEAGWRGGVRLKIKSLC